MTLIKPGYKTSEFWFTLVSFIFSGLFLTGIIGENQAKEDLIQETTRGLEATILVGGQLVVLCRYIRGRNELKKLWWDNSSKKEKLIVKNKGDNKRGPKRKIAKPIKSVAECSSTNKAPKRLK